MSAPHTIKVKDAPHYKAVHPKTMLFCHATVSPTSAHFRDGRSGALGDFSHWREVRRLEKYNLGTYAIGDADGKVYQGFDDRYWAHHLGVPGSEFRRLHLSNINTWLNKHSIGYELDCLGPLDIAPEDDGTFWTAIKGYQKSRFTGAIRVPEKNVVFYPDGFRGHHFYERFTDQQIATAKRVFKHLCEKHGIPTEYREDQWDVSERALKGLSGIWQHVSVRSDKSDCHPQPELIEMLKELSPKKTTIVKPVAPLPKYPVVFTEKYFDDLEKETLLLWPLTTNINVNE